MSSHFADRLCDAVKTKKTPLIVGLDPVYNAVDVAELAVEKGATTLLIPISARRQLNELSDEMAMKLSILYYADAREALLKALGN